MPDPSSRSALVITSCAARSLKGMSTALTHERYTMAAGPSGTALTLSRNFDGTIPSRAACRSIALYDDFDAVTHASNGP